MNSKITIKDYEKAFVSNRKKAKQELTKWVNSTFVIMMGLIISLFFYYVWSLNANATAGYEIRELEKEKNQLLSEKEIITVKISQLESSDNINKDESAKQDMEKVVEPDYLVIKQGVQYVYNN